MYEETTLSSIARKYRDQFQAFLDGEISFKELEDWYWPERRSDLSREEHGEMPRLHEFWEVLYHARVDSAIDSYYPNRPPDSHVGVVIGEEELRHDLQDAVTKLSRLVTSAQ